MQTFTFMLGHLLPGIRSNLRPGTYVGDFPTNQALTTLSVDILTAAGRLCGRVRRSAKGTGSKGSKRGVGESDFGHIDLDQQRLFHKLVVAFVRIDSPL